MSPDARFNLALGSVIARLRERKDLTQVAFAKKTGLSQSHLSRIESGARAIRIDELRRVADVLKTDATGLCRHADFVLAALERVANAIKPGTFERADLTGLVAFVLATVDIA